MESQNREAVASPEDVGNLPDHPKGTLAVMLIYATLFALGWAFLYFFVFIGRGAPSV